MTFVTAQHVAPEIPIELAVAVGNILERTHQEESPKASALTCARETRKMMRGMDLETALAILCAEGREN